MVSTRLPLWAAAACLCLAGCQRDAGQERELPAALVSEYRAEILRTDYGVPHITAGDYGSLGFGEGYAAAEDNLCDISRGFVEARGELARYFGPGSNDEHVARDVAVRALDIRGQAVTALGRQSEELLDWTQGWAAGFNHYLSVQDETTAAGRWCAGAEWLRPIHDSDLMARTVLLSQTLPRLAEAMLAAEPPDTEGFVPSLPPPGAALERARDAMTLVGTGSNAWALGAARTENGRGLLLGNPHYPWYGSERFWEKHLTIPGELDIYGVHLLGAPGVAIGFNQQLGWSHTVSASQRLVFHELTLVEGNPTSYLLDGEPRNMTERRVIVPVLGEDGVVAQREHIQYFSIYGPVVVLPDMPWSDKRAYAVRDANAGNHSALAQWLDMGRADSMDAFIEAHREWNAMPWVNTIAASRDGRALYLDNSTVGHLSEQAIAAWRARVDAPDSLAGKLWRNHGQVLLDGSESANTWQVNPLTAMPETVPFDERPRAERADHVFNANDAYWLYHAQARLEEHSPLYGRTAVAQSLRTRMNALLLAEDGPWDYAGDDGKFALPEIQAALFGNDSLAAHLLLPELREACAAAGDAPGAACTAIAGFNGRFDVDSPGAVLFREWLARWPYAATRQAGELFATQFDSADPLHTPRGLADPALAVERLKAAATVLEAAGIPLDAPLGELQAAYLGEKRLPVHGGNAREGVANLMISGTPGHPLAAIEPRPVADSRLLTDAGYPIVHGGSFILALGFDDDGPIAEALLSYGQSANPASAHFADQAALYREKRWRPALFDRQAVEAAAQSRLELVAPRR